MPTATSGIVERNGISRIFIRLWDDSSKAMTPTLARHILKLAFSEADKARMHELAEKNGEGKISPSELAELDEYIYVADLIGILQSRARILLRKKQEASMSVD